MSLIGLPGELLFQVAEIISRTAPNDIEEFGSACRRTRGVASPLIREHRKLLKEYTKLSVDNAGAAHVLFEICKRPWVALYPRTLQVSANRNWRTLERPRNKKQLAVVEDFSARRSTITDDELEDTILRTGLIPKQETFVWVNAVKSGDEDFLFALLLACLSNLQRFVIRLDTNKMEQVKETVRAIKRRWSVKPTLPHLRTVHVLEREGASTCDLEMFPLFAAIPGVQKMHGSVRTASFPSPNMSH